MRRDSETSGTPAPSREPPRDLGFGSVVASQSRHRLLNRDGSFNVARRGLPFRAALSLYHSLITMSWPAFLGLCALAYLVLNLLFAVGYLLCGRGAVEGADSLPLASRLLQDFFFSVQTLSTVGYGHLTPANLAANLLMTLESMVGMFSVALGTGLVFARFSRPKADIAFSRRAVVAPYRGGTGFMFRIANRRKNQIVDLQAKVIFSRFEETRGQPLRRFYELALERDKVTFFPLSWTLVHPIDEASPLRGLTREDCLAADAEFLVLLQGMDETFSQAVHARSSYKADEIEWGARFTNILQLPTPTRPLSIDLHRLHDIESVTTPESPAATSAPPPRTDRR